MRREDKVTTKRSGYEAAGVLTRPTFYGALTFYTETSVARM
jgi:hypothetical protein